MLMFFFVLFFQNQLFSNNSFKNTIRVPNGSDPDQARRFVGPDLVPNCLQRLSADDTVTSAPKLIVMVSSPSCNICFELL